MPVSNSPPARTPFYAADGSLSRQWTSFFEGIVDKRAATFNLAVGGSLEVGKETPFACPLNGGRLAGWIAVAKTAAAGADIQIDVLRNGVSIFQADKPIVIPAGSTDLVVGGSNFAGKVGIAPMKDLIHCRVLQIGSTAAGGDVSVVLFYHRLDSPSPKR